MKGQFSECERPKDIGELQIAIRKGAPIDRRTRVGKAIQCVKTAVKDNLNQTARTLLEEDVALAQTVQQMCLEKAFSETDKALSNDGYPSRALSTWAKYSQLKKSALLALKKFQETEFAPPPDKSLGDLILETEDEDEDPGQTTDTEPDVKAEPTDQQSELYQS